jgi:hypothetical protein
MWDTLFRVNWGRLTHAYGWARDVPSILHNIVARDQARRAEGWEAFFSAIVHQGSIYDSTVATIPFLIEAAANPDTPERARILYYLRKLWLRAQEHGGDSLVAEPPGGTDIPTPMVGDEQLAVAPEQTISATAEQDGEDEPDLDSYRRLDLCAWQIGRAIQAGQPTFERLLDDSDLEVAADAAAILLLWPATRRPAKQTLIRAVAREPNPLQQARRILEFGVYAAAEDVNTLGQWISLDQPTAVQAAAALVWAWLTNPGPVPPLAAAALRTTTDPGCDAFAKLPRAGVYHRGPWLLPANAADLVLRLAKNNDRELRWRTVQGLAEHRETAKHLSAAQVVPVLLKCLTDDYNRIRAAAAVALSQHGEAVLDVEPNAVLLLIRALEAQQSPRWDDQALHLDSDASVCGHAARLLAALSRRLTNLQQQAAVAAIDRAARRYAGRDAHVWFDHMHVRASQFLSDQRNYLSKSTEWSLKELFAAFLYPEQSDRRLSARECDRKLADAYARAPKETIACAVEVVRAGRDRHAVVGAAGWLMTLGPPAEPALEALDAMADGEFDGLAREQARVASAYIREALLITPDGEYPAHGEPSVRQRITQLRRAADTPDHFDGTRDTLIPELTGLLEHPDAYVRTGAAEGLALLVPTLKEAALAIPILEQMLIDEDFAEVGIVGEFTCGGRLFHWRRERRSPRAGAIQALFAIGWKPDNDQILIAMLAEAQLATIVCGESVEPHRFPIDQWRMASQAAGGYSVADALIRTARQQCQNQLQADNNAPSFCAAELSEVIRVLSGRLVPTSDNHRLV